MPAMKIETIETIKTTTYLSLLSLFMNGRIPDLSRIGVSLYFFLAFFPLGVYKSINERGQSLNLGNSFKKRRKTMLDQIHVTSYCCFSDVVS
jgi:hypothetical protein